MNNNTIDANNTVSASENNEKTITMIDESQVVVNTSSQVSTYSWVDGNMSDGTTHTVGTSLACSEGTSQSCENRMYIAMDMPSLPKNPRIKKAVLSLFQESGVNDPNNIPKFGLYYITGDIVTGECTPGGTCALIDYDWMKADDENGELVGYEFDITALADKVDIASCSDVNFMIKVLDEDLQKENAVTFFGSTSVHKPTLSITYELNHGMNSSYRTHTHELGRFGQLIAEKWYSEQACQNLVAHYKYVYDGQGNICRSIDILNAIEYTYMYNDGRICRATESTVTFGTNEMVTGKTVVNAIRYSYDSEGNLTKKRIIAADGTEQVICYEKAENDSQVVKFTAGGKTVTSHSKTDSFGRKEFDELQLGTGFVSRQFTYYAGEVTDEHKEGEKLKSTPTTQLVSQIILSDGMTLSYAYDEEERIVSVTEKGNGIDNTVSYAYDALGQLTAELINGVPVNLMTYDNYGNILSKNGVAYTYGDTVWKDRLTAVGDKAIIYDAQGNPISYLGHSLAWEKGRQLKYFDCNTYTYNANGIRISKTVNGVKHEYVLDGTKILRETWEDNTIIPLYDNEESVCGIIYNDVPYYFHKNLQGDIISIVDANGDFVARYSYDAWGVCSVADANSVEDYNIAIINPFRYRGYYYDAEIGMYYLQSRYYDPAVGRFINADDGEPLEFAQFGIDKNLYSYCANGPTYDSDKGGNLSFSGVKRAIKDIVNNIKSFIVNLVNYIKKQFNKFISRVSCHFNRGYLNIPTAPIGHLIDAVITTITGLIKGALLKGGFSIIKLWFKSNRPALKTFVRDTVIPILKNTDYLFNSLIAYITQRFGRKYAWTITKSRIEDCIWGKYDFYRWVSAVSSVGSFVATVLDILDGKWDNQLAV